MRKIIVMMSVSVDGFMEGPNREIDWHRVDGGVHEHFNERLATMGAFLDGRVTYELMADFWPTADLDPDAPAAVREFARIWREMPKIVYSTTLTDADWNTTIKRSVDVDEVRALQASAGGDLVLGGADLTATFRSHNLIDEYSLYVNPVVLGGGKALFAPSGTAVDLELAETRTFGNGVVLLRYERA